MTVLRSASSALKNPYTLVAEAIFAVRHFTTKLEIFHSNVFLGVRFLFAKVIFQHYPLYRHSYNTYSSVFLC